MIPYSDGGLRRRMSSGTIVLLGAAFSLVVGGHPIATELYNITLAIFSQGGSVGAVVFLLLVYAVGGLVEVVADTFVNRIAGNAAWAFFSNDKKQNWIRRSLSVCFAVPLRAGYYMIRALIGQSMFRWESPDCDLTPIAKGYFGSFPIVVREGIKRPFDRHMEVASRFFSDLGVTDKARDFAHRLESRHRDVSVIMTAFYVALASLVSATSILGDQIRTLRLGVIANGAFTDILLIVTLVFLLVLIGLHVMVWSACSYFLLLRRVLLATIEYNTLVSEAVVETSVHDQSARKQ